MRLAHEHAIGFSQHLLLRHDLIGQDPLVAEFLQLALDKVDQHVKRQRV
jgi:hypothetical protein